MCTFGAGTWDKISDKFIHIATILELCENFRQSALDKKALDKKATILNRFLSLSSQFHFSLENTNYS